MKKIFTNLFTSMLHLISACFVLAIISLSNKVQAQATYNATGSWTCPAGITSVTVQCWGAGGAGGGNSTTSDGGGGGGGGAFTSKSVTVSQGNTYNFTVGAGGTGVAGGNGNSGGDTYFPTVSPTVKALGGQGGFKPVSGAGGVAGNGGASSGIGSIFHLGAAGGTGRNNNNGTGGGGGSSAGTALDGVAGTAGTATPGAGGTAPAGGGDGGDGAASNGNGNAGSIPGGGGGGSGDENNSANRAGGNGANGQIVIVYPSITSFSPTAICTGTTPTITLTGLNLTGATAVKFNGVNASSFTVVNSTTITAVPPAGVATGYITVTIGSNIPSTITQFTVNSLPTVAITPNWCTGGGFVGLQATLGMATYLWNNGATTSFISVNQAANYSVSVTNGAGCSNSASLQVGTELVTNGNFSAGNTGFTTSYTYTADVAGQTELYPEGKYGVGTSANNYHDLLYGTDHTTGTGNFMIVNGDPATGSTIWAENGLTVTPNTNYYFSAWGLSIYNANNAVLQFAVNGLQVGTVAYLPNGYTVNSGPYTWVKFYGTWNSGPATTANISIVDLQTILGGNDFGLDDISFGTLSPVSLGLAADANGNNGTCIGDPLNLNSNALGGISPFTYVWSSTTGFSSTLANPLVTASAGAGNSGTYTVTVTDVHGCTATSSTTITVSAPPTTSLTTTAASASVCSGTSTTINVSNSQSGVYYQLRNNAGNVNIGSPVAGTGVATPISLPTGNLTSTTTFNVLASNFSTDCSAQLTTTPTVTVATTPVLVISNQTICTGTVDLTLAAVTAGSSGGGTLSYWTNAAGTTPLTSPPPTAVNVNGTYYIKSTVGSCTDIEPVVVNIGSIPAGAAFSYTGSPYCGSGTDPLPVLTGGAIADVFSSTAGLVFISTSTGQIDLSASTPGTYTVTLTMTPGGACPVATRTTSITITAATVATFSYASSGLCQSVNAIDPSPVFGSGGAAGTFTASSPLLSLNSSGVIDISASTPGNYSVINARTATGGCAAVSDTESITINPYTFTGSLNSSSSSNSICLGSSVDLYSAGTSYLTVLLTDNFNGSFNSWDKFNTSSGGTPANAAWTLRSSPYTSGVTFSSNDATQFYLSSSALQGAGGTTSTILQSPAMSTIGFSSLSLNFYHYYRDNGASGDDANVEISTNGSTWSNLANYTTTQGASNGFVNVSISLNSYLAQPTVYIRFRYTASNDYYWAIDNVVISGNSTVYSYAWTSSPVGYTSSIDNPTGVTPLVNTFYVVTATNNYGCSTPTSPVPVAVNTPPTDHAGADVTTCSGSPAGIGAASTFGNTYSWSPSTGLSSTIVSNPNASPTTTTTYTLTETVTSTGCSSINTVTVTVNPIGQWLGTVSVDWNNPANWCGGVPTSSTDVIIPAGTVPFEPSVNNLFSAGPSYCRNITIGAGHTLTIVTNGDLRVYGSITITGTYTHTGGLLELLGTIPQTLPAITAYDLLINNTSGSGVTLGGNLTVNGNMTVDNSFVTAITTVKTLNIAGNITLQNGATMDDNCTDFLNITTSSATAAQIFRGNGQLIKCLNLTSVKTAGSLTFSVTGGSTDSYIQNNLITNFTGGTALFKDNGNTLSVGNNAQLGGTSSTNYNLTGTIKFICIGATLASDNHLSDYAGTGVTVAKLNHLVVLPENGSIIKTVQFYPVAGGQTVYVNGNLTISATNSPTLDPLNNTISINGNWSDYAATGFTEGTSQVVFAGTASSQSITGAESFNKIEINNANGVAINNTTIASSELKLTNGILTTGANEMQVTSNATASVISYSTASYVSGNLRRTISTTNNLVYDFPVGSSANYELATLKFTNTTGLGATPTVLAFFTTGLPSTMPNNTTCHVNGNGMGGMLNSGYWTLTPSAFTSGTTTYDVTLAARGYSNFSGNANQMGIIKRHDNTFAWTGAGGANSANEGSHSNATQSIAGGSAIAKRTGVKTFSEYGIGYSSNPLPVELTTFTAKAVDNKSVALFWNTQAELNCSYFSVERSADGNEFSEIGKVTGNGTSQIAHDYNFSDNSPLCGTAYYRLMQVDENGEYHYTPIASAVINCNSSFSFFPNPTSNTLSVNMSTSIAANAAVKIMGMDGKIYLQKNILSNQFSLDVKQLPAGFYFMQIENGNETMNNSFIKE